MELRWMYMARSCIYCYVMLPMTVRPHKWYRNPQPTGELKRFNHIRPLRGRLSERSNKAWLSFGWHSYSMFRRPGAQISHQHTKHNPRSTTPQWCSNLLKDSSGHTLYTAPLPKFTVDAPAFSATISSRGSSPPRSFDHHRTCTPANAGSFQC